MTEPFNPPPAAPALLRRSAISLFSAAVCLALGIGLAGIAWGLRLADTDELNVASIFVGTAGGLSLLAGLVVGAIALFVPPRPATARIVAPFEITGEFVEWIHSSAAVERFAGEERRRIREEGGDTAMLAVALGLVGATAGGFLGTRWGDFAWIPGAAAGGFVVGAVVFGVAYLRERGRMMRLARFAELGRPTRLGQWGMRFADECILWDETGDELIGAAYRPEIRCLELTLRPRRADSDPWVIRVPVPIGQEETAARIVAELPVSGG